MRVGMNKTKVMISGERQTVRQKAVRWPCGVCSKYEIFLLVCINNTVLRGLVVIADTVETTASIQVIHTSLADCDVVYPMH